MKKISALLSALLIFGCSQDNSDSSNKKNDDQNVQKALFTEKDKEFLNFVIKDEFETLADNGEVNLTEFYPIYTAEKITSDYGQNEIRANNLYKSKQFFITGKIGGIDAGIDDKPVVNLKTNANYGFNSPLLKFNKIDQEKVAELNKGQKVTLLCTGKSEIAGTPILENCMFLQTLEKQMIEDILKFEDQDLSGKNNQYKQAIFSFVISTLLFNRASNNFEQCSVVDNSCIQNISKTTSKEDIQKLADNLKAQFPKANESKEKMKQSEE
ncbi:OB-fold protein [Acinetobacter wanghuae]|uniref:OB-fold protein n=1 Tax=Acinetobacter wanghuae TaxID=2662362 RepID=UPI003AF8D5C6